VAHLFAIENDDPILPGSQDLVLPAQEHPLHEAIIDPMQEPGKGRFLGTANVSAVRVGSKSQGRN
jgi:hypothetical protein